MSSLIKIYKGTVTSGLTDGDLVSSGTGLSPVESGVIKVPAMGYTDGDWIKLAARCDDGYKTIEDFARHARIAIAGGAGVDKWQLAVDDANSPGVAEDWGEHLDVLAEVSDANHIFWARARVAHTESPSNDDSVDVTVSATIGVI